ncbi:hypothetical protein [Hymenobacter volaticus]|uniref:GLPGLI family protein n=1 Tax=Hymenobacter volaticus TaxID=2932254 RepID=A0ABY4GE15_9BACT|nr:hypothetical protein [Hymenobacter volaticus]UOQ69150.1 hypothetical protein MUN86_25890 [Hymenobacter volaticus]
MPWCRFRLASLFGLLGTALVSRAQAPSPLHSFFQQHFDSTLVYQSSSHQNASPNYLILAKHQNRLAFFTYTSPYRDVLGHYYPGPLVQKFGQEDSRFRATVPDTNRYLLPKRIAEETLRPSWYSLVPPQLWAIPGDEQARSATGACMSEDGEEITLYLIDKKAIRAARFYAPTFYEVCVGKDAGRQQVIQLRNTLQQLLQSVH